MSSLLRLAAHTLFAQAFAVASVVVPTISHIHGLTSLLISSLYLYTVASLLTPTRSRNLHTGTFYANYLGCAMCV